MTPESLPPLGLKGATLLGFLAGEIAKKPIRKGEPESFVTYADALRGLGVVEIHHAGQQLNREGLLELNDWTTSDPGLPRIAALIVNQETHRPSDPFLKSHGREPDDWAWWMDEANKAIDFDWSPYLAAANAAGEPTARVREGEDELTDYRGVVTLEPGPAHIRQTNITVAEILQWMAAGQSEEEIITHHPDLGRTDIRATLSYAADRERSPRPTESGRSRLAIIAGQWAEKLALPKTDPNDARRDELLRRYWRAGE